MSVQLVVCPPVMTVNFRKMADSIKIMFGMVGHVRWVEESIHYIAVQKTHPTPSIRGNFLEKRGNTI